MKTRISKAYRGTEHIGWKKTVGGRECFLGCGISPADEAKAIQLAEVSEALWKLAKTSGAAEFSETDFEEAKALIAGQPRQATRREITAAAIAAAAAAIPAAPPRPPVDCDASHGQSPNPLPAATQPGRRWLYEAIDEFVATIQRSLKADGSNGDYVNNTCERILRARDGIENLPLDLLRRKEMDDWLLNVRNLPSKMTGRPLSPVTIRNMASVIRTALGKFAEWEWWIAPPLWEKAFRNYSIKKLETPDERKERKKRPPEHSVDEKRVLWHLGLPFDRAMMCLADWAGHTQTEIATMTFDEIKDKDGEMFIERDRHKTGVCGRWWIPPEAAAVIREVVRTTPRDRSINPKGLAFLTPHNMPLVHRALHNKRARSDYVGSNLWGRLLRAGRSYGVRHISFKFMRKGMAQRIRDKCGREVSRTFLAHADEDIQDENYTRACLLKVEEAARGLYPELKGIFKRIERSEWPELMDRLAQLNPETVAR